MPSSRSADHKEALSSTFLGVGAAYVLTALISISFSTPASALQTVPGSQCESICDPLSFANDTVCLDKLFEEGEGSQFRQCTTCLLNSTAVDTAKNVSDVYWGLFNLRYTLGECIYAYPAEIVSVSNPCQVTCQQLENATTYEIGPDKANATVNTVPNLDFCQNGFGPDTKINNCSFCYSFVPQQLYMANFMQALHIACRDPPTLGNTFYPNGNAIFNESAIAGPAPPSSGNKGSSGLKNWQLALAIALPIVGGTFLFALTCFCCFKFTKKRRARMAAAGRMSTYTKSPDGMGGSHFATPVTARTPPSQYQWPVGQHEPPREMDHLNYAHAGSSKQPSPGMVQTRWSHHTHGNDDEDAVPLSAEPRDDVGPGHGQAQDPFLHEQYFGQASSSGFDETPEMTGYVYPPPSEPGHFVR